MNTHPLLPLICPHNPLMQVQVKTKAKKVSSSGGHPSQPASKTIKLSSKTAEVPSSKVARPDLVSDQNGEDSNVEVPDPNLPSGFERGMDPECIMGASKVDGQVLLLIKWYVLV